MHQYFMYGVGSFTIMITLLVGSTSYITRSLILLLYEYGIFRISSNTDMNLTLPVMIQLFLILQIPVLYMVERTQKKNHYSQFQQQHNLKIWRKLLDKTIPLPVFVLQNSQKNEKNQQNQLELEFANKKCQEQFGILDSQGAKIQKSTEIDDVTQNLFFKKLNEIYKACQPDLSIKTILQQKLDKIYRSDNIVNSDMIESGIRKSNPGSKGDFQLGNKSEYNDFIEKKLVDDKINEKHLNFITVECLWNDRHSLMIMISDNTYTVHLKQMQEYKDQILAQVSHDLRTPLNGMICQLEAAQLETNFQEIQKEISIVRKNCHLLMSVINDLLDYSQMLKGKLRMVISRFDFRETIEEVIELFKFQTNKKQIELSYEFEEEEYSLQQQIFIQNDPCRLKQVLMNLVGNALKHTFTGSIKLKISVLNDDLITVKVIDTGIGMSKQVQDQLFTMYSTFNNQSQCNQRGVGLGLVICQRLAKQIGQHDIKVESQEGKGSTFMFSVYRQMNMVLNQSTIIQKRIRQDSNTKNNLVRSISLGIQQNIQKQKQQNTKAQYDQIIQKSHYWQTKQQQYIPTEKSIPFQDMEKDLNLFIHQNSFKKMHQNLHESQILFNNPFLNNSSNQQIKMQKLQSIQMDTHCNLILNNIEQEKNSNSSNKLQRNSINLNQNRQNSMLMPTFNSLNENIEGIRVKRLSINQQSLLTGCRKSNLSTYQQQLQSLRTILPQEKASILVVDDSIYNILGIQTLFKPFKNIQIDECYNGQMAIDKIIENQKNNSFDKQYFLVFMDVDMPVMDGLTATQIIKEKILNGELNNVAIVQITAYGQEKDIKKCLNAGADAFVDKPITFQKLITVLNELFHQHNSKTSIIKSEIN